MEEEKQEEPRWKTALKYFLHGFAFSVIFFILAIVWAFILVVLIMAGALIGLIIGLIILLFFIGGLNSFLTDLIWSIPIKTKWTSLLGHGLLLFIALIIVEIPALLIVSAAPGILTTIVLIIVYPFVDGFVAKNIAAIWKVEEEEEEEEEHEENIYEAS